MKIKINKATNELIFKCKGQGEIQHILDTYILGNEKIIEDARKIFKNIKTVQTEVKTETHGMTGVWRVIKVDASEFEEGTQVKVTIEEL